MLLDVTPILDEIDLCIERLIVPIECGFERFHDLARRRKQGRHRLGLGWPGPPTTDGCGLLSWVI